jgi:AraC-like DNA-binding protein
MTLNFTWFNLLVLFGAVQALIFSIVLLFNKKHPGSMFFAAFIFVFSYNGFETFNWSAGLDQHFMFFDMFGFIVIYGAGPSLYLYVNKLLFPEIQFSRKQLLIHYGIMLFQFTARIGIIVYHLLWINDIIGTSVHSKDLMDFVWSYAEPLSVVVFLAYYVATIMQFKKYKRANTARLQAKDRQNVIRWLEALLIAMGIFAIVWPITVLAPDLFNIPFGPHYYPIELGLVLFSYWIVFYGYLKVKSIRVKPMITSDSYVDNEIRKTLSRLQESMEQQKFYLDPELSVSKLASHTGIPAKTISAILNQHHQVNFNDFVNGYRIREVQSQLADPNNRHLTISGIALEAGFNSQATFQRVFKNNLGMSPREYLNQQTLKKP